MEYICGVAAVIILVVGVIMITSSIKSGKVLDCIEGSKTEKQWIFRSEDPGRYRMLIKFYVIFFVAVIVMLGWVAIGGQPTP